MTAKASPPTAAPAHDDRAAVVALSGLPGMGPARLRVLLGRGPAGAVWADLRAGRLPVDRALAATCTGRDGPAEVVARWVTAAGDSDPAAHWDRHAAAGIDVLLPGDAAWPVALVDDPDPPAVLFVRGAVAVLAGQPAPAAALVGTRRASRYGLDVAGRLGGELSAAGVAVVSGLAAGIDGAAHRGALDAATTPPVGVVATGLDVIYPRGHRRLWQEVAEAGVLVSEVPMGTPPARWRFPARNRIIAALAGAVVVVESGVVGGSLHTVDEAARRDRPVLAVPGPVTSPVSAGTNRLLADGASPACDTGDILVTLGLGGRDRAASTPAPGAPDDDAALLLDALGWQPATLDQLVLRTGLSLGTVARIAAGLEVDGWLATDGGWFERRR